MELIKKLRRGSLSFVFESLLLMKWRSSTARAGPGLDTTTYRLCSYSTLQIYRQQLIGFWQDAHSKHTMWEIPRKDMHQAYAMYYTRNFCTKKN